MTEAWTLIVYGTVGASLLQPVTLDFKTEEDLADAKVEFIKKLKPHAKLTFVTIKR